MAKTAIKLIVNKTKMTHNAVCPVCVACRYLAIGVGYCRKGSQQNDMERVEERFVNLRSRFQELGDEVQGDQYHLVG